MRSQQKLGGQHNDTLQLRTKLRWMLPPVGSLSSERLLNRAAKLYYSGDKDRGLRQHRGPLFFDPRCRASAKYATSKVVDRHRKLESRCPFIGGTHGDNSSDVDVTSLTAD
jgi:hypothetical protein